MVWRRNALVLMGIFAVILLILKVTGAALFGYSMSLYTLILIGFQFATWRRSKDRNDLFSPIAFAFMMLGDIFLNFTSYGILHIASFAVSLIILTIGWYRLLPIKTSLKSLGVIAVISALLYAAIVVPVLPHKLSVHFFIYIILLTFLIWRAYSYLKSDSVAKRHGAVLFAGAVLFYVTDILVGIRIIYKPALINAAVYSFYPASLLLMAFAPMFRREQHSRLDQKS